MVLRRTALDLLSRGFISRARIEAVLDDGWRDQRVQLLEPSQRRILGHQPARGVPQQFPVARRIRVVREQARDERPLLPDLPVQHIVNAAEHGPACRKARWSSRRDACRDARRLRSCAWREPGECARPGAAAAERRGSRSGSRERLCACFFGVRADHGPCAWGCIAGVWKFLTFASWVRIIPNKNVINYRVSACDKAGDPSAPFWETFRWISRVIRMGELLSLIHI